MVEMQHRGSTTYVFQLHVFSEYESKCANSAGKLVICFKQLDPTDLSRECTVVVDVSSTEYDSEDDFAFEDIQFLKYPLSSHNYTPFANPTLIGRQPQQYERCISFHQGYSESVPSDLLGYLERSTVQYVGCVFLDCAKAHMHSR